VPIQEWRLMGASPSGCYVFVADDELVRIIREVDFRGEEGYYPTREAIQTKGIRARANNEEEEQASFWDDV